MEEDFRDFSGKDFRAGFERFMKRFQRPQKKKEKIMKTRKTGQMFSKNIVPLDFFCGF